jgi:hypothetical protein
MALTWMMGFEIELMAPPGRSRAHLARRVAGRLGGSIRRFFHPQSEPSKAHGTPVFDNLTPGFEVVDGEGRRVAAFVDDLTLRHGLNRQAPPAPGWSRVVADDGRLLQLVIRHCDPDAALPELLDPLAALFGTMPQRHPAGMVRVVDARGVSVAIGAPLPGERERPCEIVTAPIEAGHEAILGALLADARAEGFTLPLEGATHIHFDAAPLCSAPVIAVLIETLWAHGGDLRRLVGANPNCVRLGSWDESIIEVVRSAGFRSLAWPDAQEALRGAKLSKYCDYNILNLAREDPLKHTFEVRVPPTALTPEPILAAAGLFEAFLWWCRDAGSTGRAPATLSRLLEVLPLPPEARRHWLERAADPLSARPSPTPTPRVASVATPQ